MSSAPADEWSLVYEGFDPAREPLREALCTLGNGVFATRGAAPEASARDPHYPATYMAGGYNRALSRIAGRTIENEDLVNFPNWLVLRFRLADNGWFTPGAGLADYSQELDLRRGVLIRQLCVEDADGRRTRVTQRRLVHMEDPHWAALETTFLAENWSGEAVVQSLLDGTVVNSGVARYRQLEGRHLRVLDQGPVGDDSVYLHVETRQSRLALAQAARTRVHGAGSTHRLLSRPGEVGHELRFTLAEAVPVTVEKTVRTHTSRDRAISEPALDARTWIGRAPRFSGLLERHVLAWDELWRRFDIDVEADDHTRMTLRLHVFHLLQTVSPNTIGRDVGVPARGLHGEAYRGHIFWDEMFIFPLLNLRLPALTRSLLGYRFRRLPEARWAAAQAGFEGAMFPWQSGSNGREESQVVHLNPKSGRWVPDNSHLQRHIGIAVAYNVWQYVEVTGDEAFLRFTGAELLIEVARFLASLTTYHPALGRYEIRGVMGPDEYHEGYPGAASPGVDNNAYTNVMTVWVLERARNLLQDLPEPHRRELTDKLGVRQEEVDRWEDIARKMRVVFHDGVISQFEGYENLEELDWDGYRERYGDIHRLDRILEAEGDSANRYKLSKQADVLMLFYLLSFDELTELFKRLGYGFDEPLAHRTVDYYLARSAHGSTLSSVVHSWVLARVDRSRSWQFFTQALASDVSDVQGGTTQEGIHLGAMAGTVDLVLRCYAGLVVRDEALWLDPVLPEELPSLAFALRYRGHRLDVQITADLLRVRSLASSAPPMSLGVRGARHVLAAGDRAEFSLA